MKCLLNHLSSFPSFPNRASTHLVFRTCLMNQLYIWMCRWSAYSSLIWSQVPIRFWELGKQGMCVYSVTQLCPLWPTMNCGLIRPPIHGIFQAFCQYSLLEWVVISAPTGSLQTQTNPFFLHSCLCGKFLPLYTTWEVHRCRNAKSCFEDLRLPGFVHSLVALG